MEKQLPEDVKKLLSELFTLIGESLIDEQIENREQFEKAQNDIAKILKAYKVKIFEWVKEN